MTSTIFRPFGPLRPLLLCIVFSSGYSGTLLATESESIPYPAGRSAVTGPATLEYKWKHVEGAEEYAFSIRDHRLTREQVSIGEHRIKGIIYNPDQTIRHMAADVCSEETAICKVSSADTVLLENFGRYSWRVKAFKAGKRIGVQRNVFFLSANTTPETTPFIVETPAIAAPRDNQVYALPSKPSFEWTHSLPAGPAEHYIVRVVDITDRSDRKLTYRAKLAVADACLLDSCTYTLNPAHRVGDETGELLQDKKYRFTVRASNGYDRSKVARAKFTITSPVAEGTVAEGYDWNLPEYVSGPEKVNTSGGLVREQWPKAAVPEDYTNTAFYSIKWSEVDYFYKKTTDGVDSYPKCKFTDNDDPACIYGFGGFRGWLNNGGGMGENVLVRLEVNSVCDLPDGLRQKLNYYASGSIAFWQDSYMNELDVFVKKFASEFASDPRIKGVHLGIADGEYTEALNDHLAAGRTLETFYNGEQATDEDDNLVFDENGGRVLVADHCADYYDQKDGWGEFWIQEAELADAMAIDDGLTVENFQTSVKTIIDNYTNAFEGFTSKLAMTNIGSFVYNDPKIAEVEDATIQAFNDIKTSKISPYVLAQGVGNRDGLIEDWMSYNRPVYGTSFKSDLGTSPVGTCKMTMDENIAEAIGDRYWGTENEEYLLHGSVPDDNNYVIDKFGKDDQYYRFMMSSLRALQMRRNHMLLNTDAMADLTQLSGIDSPYQTANFLDYLAGTLGRSKSDTPDAFVVLGERYVRTSRTTSYDEPAYTGDLLGAPVTSELSALIDGLKASGKDNLADCTADYTTVSEYGRWLTEVSGKGTKSNFKALLTGVEPFTIPSNLPSVDGETKYEYTARSSNELMFDINDAVVEKRCDLAGVCDLEVKVVFQDTIPTTLSLVTEAGAVGAIETIGDQLTKTVTFTVSGTFANGLTNGADFGLATVKDADALPVFMTRVNFLNEPASETPVLAVVAAEPN